MTTGYKTEQEAFWAGEFGDAYIERNTGEALLSSNIAMFAKIMACCPGARSLLEFGANVGMNLRALHALLPQLELEAIEINDKAVAHLRTLNFLKQVHHGSVLDFASEEICDVALIKGVLIHINPDHLTQVYESLYRASRRYIVIAEYYNPAPVEVSYRGHSGRLFKRDFPGEMLERHAGLRLIDYGFVYHRDPLFPQDDVTWFVLEKRP